VRAWLSIALPPGHLVLIASAVDALIRNMLWPKQAHDCDHSPNVLAALFVSQHQSHWRKALAGVPHEVVPDEQTATLKRVNSVTASLSPISGVALPISRPLRSLSTVCSAP
jgi:hypothetical protein